MRYWTLLPLFVASLAVAEPVGLVLSGGGAKGAYQVGVWKALVETGLAKDVRAISGTSIGAINAALFATIEDPPAAERLWLERMEEVMREPNGEPIRAGLQSLLDDTGSALDEKKRFIEEETKRVAASRGVAVEDLDADTLDVIEKQSQTRFMFAWAKKRNEASRDFHERFLSDRKEGGLVDPDALREILDASLPESWASAAPDVYATALQKGVWQKTVFHLNGETHARRISMLRASSAIPVVFDNVEIDGSVYVDGGWSEKGGDNVPVDPIVENHPEIKTIYVVYLNSEKELKGSNDLVDVRKYPDVRIVEIFPSEKMYGWFGAMNFSPKMAGELILLGYADACRCLGIQTEGKQNQ